MSDMPSPEYTNPPVVETVLGIQFNPLAKLSNGHLGAFWASLDQSEWTSAADAPPLEPQFELFKETQKWGRSALRIKVSQDFTSRLQITNTAGDRMLQVQNGRLHFNWRGTGADYPRYEKVLPQFRELFDKFRAFVEQKGLGKIVANQWEVTYVNHIPKNSVWREPEQWDFFRPLSSAPRIGPLDRLESFSGEWHYVIMENAGRLHIQWHHGANAVDKENAVEIIQLMLTARGPVPEPGDSRKAVVDGLNLGHDTIVSAFRKLMSDPANEFWGLKDEA